MKTVGSCLMGLGCVWVGGRDELKDHWATVHWDDQTSLDMAASNALVSKDYFTCTLFARLSFLNMKRPKNLSDLDISVI